MVVAPSVAQVHANVAERLVHAAPILLRRAPDRNRTAAAVVWLGAEIEIVFELDEVRQNLRARPSDASLTRPQVEVLERRANRDLPVYRGAAADAAPAPIHHRILRVGASRLERGPLEFLEMLERHHHPGRIRDAHLGRRLGGSVIRPSFKQQNAARSILGKARSQHCTRRTGANDDDVVLAGAAG